jgi:hypothetical protein
LILDSIWVLDYVLNYTPFMLFVPLHRHFYGSLFSQLNYNSQTIPVSQHPDGTWALDYPVIQEWDMLEWILRALLSSVMFFTTNYSVASAIQIVVLSHEIWI